MPTYDFKCKKCSEVVGVHFKGSGFYSTDSRAKPKPAAETTACDAAGSTPACADCPSAD